MVQLVACGLLNYIENLEIKNLKICALLNPVPLVLKRLSFFSKGGDA